MYIPDAFRIANTAEAQQVIAENEFGALTTVDADGLPFATHLPFLLKADEGEFGTLYGHMARANPQWRHFRAEQPVLCVFQGAHAYISPNWYTTRLYVPTWNYIAVHAYGVPDIISDGDRIDDLMRQLSHPYEPQPGGWRFDDMDVKQREGLKKGIVAFRLPISRLEGKAKLGQNKGDEQRLAAADGLDATGDADAARLAGEMRSAGKYSVN